MTILDPRLTLAACLGAAALLAGCGEDEPQQAERTTPTARTATTPPRLTTPGLTTTTPAPSNLPGQGAITPQDVGAAGTAAEDDADEGSATDGDGDAPAETAFRPFSEESPWNTRVDDLGPDPNSDRFIELAQERLGAVEGSDLDSVATDTRRIRDPLYVNTQEWTPPIADSEDEGQTVQVVCRQINLPPPNNDCGDGWQVPNLQVPEDVSPFPENDGWFTVIDRSAGAAYDLWRARRSEDGGVISYQFMRKWDLDGPGFLPPTVVSARGSGLPLFAGVILPEEIQAGRIEHALAIAVPGPAARRYVQPASVTNGNGSFASLPEGARIRLRDDVSTETLISRIFVRVPDDTEDQRGEGGEANAAQLGQDDERGRLIRRDFPGNTNTRAARAIIQALREYGAIVIDRAATPTLFAKRNFNWLDPLRNGAGLLLRPNGQNPYPRAQSNDLRLFTPLLRGSEVSGIRLSDFEVVRLPQLRLDPPLNANEDTTTARLGSVSPQAVPGATPGGTGPTATTPRAGASPAPGVGVGQDGVPARTTPRPLTGPSGPSGAGGPTGTGGAP